MPRPQFWYFTREDSRENGIYITVGKQLLTKYGYVTEIRTSSKDREGCIKVAFSSSDKVKMLNVENFEWDKNEFSSLFKRSHTADRFVEIFNNAAKASTSASTDHEMSLSTTEDTGKSPPAKRQKITPLIPASHARCLEEQDEDVFSISKMDTAIQTHFQGHFLLPVGCLKAPPDEWLVRDCSAKVVQQLKLEMLANNCSDVQPILCIVDLMGDDFNKDSKEGYQYWTIGGNHSRQALQELLKEKPALTQNKQYSYRLCSIYKPMDTTLIRRLASKHNRAAAYCHEMNTWDWIVQCRKLLYELSETQDDQDPPTIKPDGWKKACSSVLALTVAQLEERTIFFLASLPQDTYCVVSDIFKSYTEGKLKDQTIPRSKKGIKSLPDLKGSTFKVFRGLDSLNIHRLLTDVMNCKLSIKEAVAQCADIKAMQKIQHGFIRAMNMQSWDEAKETYPQHTTSEALEPFRHLDFSGHKLPQQFLQFCHHVRSIRKDLPVDEDHDDVFVLKHSTVGLFWKIKITNVTIDSFDVTFKKAGVERCMGFSLVVLDYALSCEMNSDQISQEIKHSVRLVRGINYSNGRQDFVVVIFSTLQYLTLVSDALDDVFDSIELAVCALPHKKKDVKVTRRNLEPVTIGILVGKVGAPPSLPQEHDNFFVHPMDQWYCDSATGKPVYEGQKPVSLMKELMELYTTPKDWIFSSPTDIGTTVIAGLQNERNVLCVEKVGMNFIHEKTRAIKLLSTSKANVDATENGEIEAAEDEEIE